MPVTDPHASFTERFSTFEGYWTRYNTTARQLAALGHVYDRPPLEALEEGSRCVTCSKFIPRRTSIRALENELDYDGSAGLDFHEKGCERLQVRLPYSTDPRLDSLPTYTIKDTLRRFRSRSSTSSLNTIVNFEESPLLRLPVEIRLEIWQHLLPLLEDVTPITTIDRYSVRTRMAKPRIWWHLDEISPAVIIMALLQSCSTIHDEFLEMLFQSTTFRFENTKLIYFFLRQIGHRGRRALSSIDITCGYRDDAICFALLGTCQSLKHITIRRCCPLVPGPLVSLWFAEGMACLTDLSGLLKVSVQDYLEAEGESDDKPATWLLKKFLMRKRGTPGFLEEGSMLTDGLTATSEAG